MMGVSPDLFVEEMQKLWLSLRNESSDALRRTWKMIALTLNAVQAGTQSNCWNILALPTGVGKTLSLALYCAMLDTDDHPGVLIVTRLIRQADQLVSTINKLAGKARAIAHHSATKLNANQMLSAPVLAITHSAYEGALGAVAENRAFRSNLSNYLEWSEGRRRLIVIDEAPPLHRSHTTTIHSIAQTHGAIRNALPQTFQADVERLNALVSALGKGLDLDARAERQLTSDELRLVGRIDFVRVVAAVSKVEGRLLRFGDAEGIDGDRVRIQCISTLQVLASVKRLGWAWIDRQGPFLQVCSSEALLPREHPGGVIMDATAELDVGYELLGQRARIITAEPGLRRYENVTVHVARNQRVGKQFLAKNIEIVWPSVVRRLTADIATDSKVLVCCQKSAEHFVTGYQTSFKNLEVAHWGAINGLNDWSEFDTVVIVGLPYLPSTVPVQRYAALCGPTTNDWFFNPQRRSFGTHSDIRAALAQGHIDSNVIQAINRSRCRKPIDALGNCATTNVFILLPNGSVGEGVIAALKSQMPGINPRPWEINVRTTRTRVAPCRDAAIGFFRDATTGRYTKAQVSGQLGLSNSSLDRFIKSIRENDSNEAAAMRHLGVKYVSRKGRGVEAYFLKE